MSKLKNLVILCGGTGGHFFPGLSIARIFKEQGGKVALITGKHKVSYAKDFSPRYNIAIHEVQSAIPSASPLFFLKTVAGMPLRPELADTKINDKAEAIASFNKLFNKAFNSKIPTLLVFGGSLGAKKINSSVPEALIYFKGTQIIHLTGKDQFQSTLELYKQTQSDYLVLEKFDDMALLYKLADIVICRSGGSTVAELDYFDKNSILIPYPLAMENHQYFNALFLQQKNPNTLIIEDKECSPDSLKKSIAELLSKPASAHTRKKFLP